MDILLIVLCGYMMVSNIRTLAGTPPAGWGGLQVVLVVITALLGLVAVWRAVGLAKKWRGASGEKKPSGQPNTIHLNAMPNLDGIELDEPGEEE